MILKPIHFQSKYSEPRTFSVNKFIVLSYIVPSLCKSQQPRKLCNYIQLTIIDLPPSDLIRAPDDVFRVVGYSKRISIYGTNKVSF